MGLESGVHEAMWGMTLRRYVPLKKTEWSFIVVFSLGIEDMTELGIGRSCDDKPVGIHSGPLCRCTGAISQHERFVVC